MFKKFSSLPHMNDRGLSKRAAGEFVSQEAEAAAWRQQEAQLQCGFGVRPMTV